MGGVERGVIVHGKGLTELQGCTGELGFDRLTEKMDDGVEEWGIPPLRNFYSIPLSFSTAKVHIR